MEEKDKGKTRRERGREGERETPELMVVFNNQCRIQSSPDKG